MREAGLGAVAEATAVADACHQRAVCFAGVAAVGCVHAREHGQHLAVAVGVGVGTAVGVHGGHNVCRQQVCRCGAAAQQGFGHRRVGGTDFDGIEHAARLQAGAICAHLQPSLQCSHCSDGVDVERLHGVARAHAAGHQQVAAQVHGFLAHFVHVVGLGVVGIDHQHRDGAGVVAQGHLVIAAGVDHGAGNGLALVVEDLDAQAVGSHYRACHDVALQHVLGIGLAGHGRGHGGVARGVGNA